MQAIYLFVAIAAIVAFAFFVPPYLTGEADVEMSEGQKHAKVCFGDACITVEVADSQPERSQGLMFREDLGKDEGMLFVFQEEGKYRFWMKNTLIPLAIVWVSKDLEVVHLENAVPCGEEQCKSYVPNSPALYVVEVHPDFARERIRIGDKVSLEL